MMRRRALLETLVIVLVGILATFLFRAHNAPPSVDVMAGSSLIGNVLLYFAGGNPHLIITVLNVTGNWMVPAVQAEAVGKIAQALGEIYPENAAYYQGNATERAQTILTYGEDVKRRLQDAGVDGVKVICAALQEGLVRWAGFDVVATFGRPEDLTPAQKADLIAQAQRAGVALVIDNLQSGSTTLGASLEEDIEAIPVSISNFPGGLENTETWEKAIDRNIDLLLAALNEWREQYG